MLKAVQHQIKYLRSSLDLFTDNSSPLQVRKNTRSFFSILRIKCLFFTLFCIVCLIVCADVQLVLLYLGIQGSRAKNDDQK